MDRETQFNKRQKEKQGESYPPKRKKQNPGSAALFNSKLQKKDENEILWPLYFQMEIANCNISLPLCQNPENTQKYMINFKPLYLHSKMNNKY